MSVTGLELLYRQNFVAVGKPHTEMPGWCREQGWLLKNSLLGVFAILE
jgi:hypothetical protein